MDRLSNARGGWFGNSYGPTELHMQSFDMAKEMFKSTKKIEWVEKAYNTRIKSAEISKEFNPRLSAYNYSFAGDMSKIIFEKTDNISMGMNAYSCLVSSAEMSKEFNPKHSAHCYGFAGDVAKRLFKRTKDKKWAQRAIDYYEQLNNFYKFSSASVKRTLRKRVKSNINQLTRQIGI
jgi:hypothetical protein